MQQVLFTLPIFTNSFPPNGIPMYGFGAMLFVCFVAVTLWGSRRAKRTADMPPERFQDMVIWLFVSGIIGARVLYMIQYAHTFPDQSLGGLLGAFFKIWEGGIIFYGSALGGVIGYAIFYHFVLRRLHIDGWRLADAVAPLLALGLAIGRIGCYLNGCCWGQVACEECRTVPLGAAHFPVLPAHARQQLVGDIRSDEPSLKLQSAVGFIRAPRFTAEGSVLEVVGVEPGSAAAEIGKLQVGDRIKKVGIAGSEPKENEMKGPTYDTFEETIRAWPRGKSKLALTVEREVKQDGKTETVTVELPPFTPRTVGLYPTQLYETTSMVLLVLFLLAYYPYRRHDGQLMVVLMVCYAFHRFVNESLRIEPAVGMGLTLSQWGSVVIFVAGVGIELYLRKTQPSRWSGQALLSPPPPPAPSAPAPAPAQPHAQGSP
jgi:phosphatidylglycerol---prolipoprotein diacylglyceryl transferase